MKKLMERWSVRLVREVSPAGIPGHVHTPADVVGLFNSLHGDSPVEVVEAFFLNVRHRVIGHTLVSRGTVDASLVQPREVFVAAILANAGGLIVVHNHPSGDPAFSADDRAIARLLADAGRILAIELVDFLAVTHDGRFSSAAEEGLL